jgi:hypothetical protein
LYHTVTHEVAGSIPVVPASQFNPMNTRAATLATNAGVKQLPQGDLEGAINQFDSITCLS